MKETRKDIKGYEGHYQVSNMGNVRSMTKKVNTKGGKKAIKHGKILKQTRKSKGYLAVNLSKNGKSRSYEVQRLVAPAFIQNPNNYPCVNHIDENKENNTVANLEWCTYKYNNIYGDRNRKSSESRINGKLSKPVYMCDVDGNILQEFPSIAEVKRSFGYDSAKISLVARGERKTAYGYTWKFKK